MMRLVIRNRYGSAAGGLRRYNGSGIFSSIGRKLFSSGLKKVINVATKANLRQKIANAVVDGAQSAGQKLGKTAGRKVTKFAGDKFLPFSNEKVPKSVKKKIQLVPEEQQLISPPTTKQAKFDNNIKHLIDSSGILLD